MTNVIPSISSAYGLSRTASSAEVSSSTSELISSFKEIMSMMNMMNSSQSGYGSSMGAGMGDLMGPLLMIILLEKLVENDVEYVTSEAKTQTETGTNSTPVNEPFGRPVEGVLTQEYHNAHHGLDFGIREGTPITSTMDGEVIYAGWNNQGYGNLVIVQNGEYKTYYAHLSSIPVAIGDQVKAGETIGLSGNTGNSTGPHLHYEIRKNNVAIDPTTVTLG